MIERPARYRNTVVPHIYVDGASDGIAFYDRAFVRSSCYGSTVPTARYCTPRSWYAARW